MQETRGRQGRWLPALARAHRAGLPARLRPRSLNPIERGWRELKDALSNHLFGTLGTRRACLDRELAAWHPNPVCLCSLTSYPYLIHALAILG